MVFVNYYLQVYNKPLSDNLFLEAINKKIKVNRISLIGLQPEKIFDQIYQLKIISDKQNPPTINSTGFLNCLINSAYYP